MIDERALNAVQAVITRWVPAQMAREVAQKAIEAYEAAKWRPIEEAPRDGKEVLVQLGWPNESHTQTVVLYFAIGHWFDCGNNAQPDEWFVGAMFRTIDPPKQDAAQGAGHARQQPIGDQSGAQ